MGGISTRWQVFVLYGLVFAIGSAGTTVAPIGVMISRWFVRRRGIANSIAISGNAVGQLVIIALLASFLTSLSWRGAFLALGAANFIIVVPLVLAFVRSRPPAEPTSEISETASQNDGVVSTSLNDIAKSRQLWLLLGVYAICGFQDFFIATHVVAFADDQGVGSVLAGNMLALMGLLGLVGVLVSGLLADAFGAARPMALCFLLRIGIFAFIIYFQSTPSILVFALLYGFTFPHHCSSHCGLRREHIRVGASGNDQRHHKHDASDIRRTRRVRRRVHLRYVGELRQSLYSDARTRFRSFRGFASGA